MTVPRRRGVPQRPTKEAKREAKVVETVQRILWLARVREYGRGHGTMLTAPVLVFVGQQHGDFRVFDRTSEPLGVVRRFEDKVAKFAGYAIYDMDGAAPLLTIKWPARWYGISGNFTLLDGGGNEIATLTSSGLTVMVESEKLGRLRLPGLKSARIQDVDGREVARIKDVRPGAWYVAEIEQSLDGPLREVAVAASVICQEKVTAGG